MNTLVGTIVEHGFVPERSAKALNALVDPMRNRRLAVQVGCVVGINLVMWLIFCIDFVHARIGDAPGAQAADGGVDGGVDGDAGGGSDQPMSNSTNSTNAADATNATIIEWEYPSETFPLFMHGVYSRRTQGLKGIPAMPFLHYHAAQLGVNSVGFVIFGAILVLKHGIFIFSTLSLFLWFFAGCARTPRAARACARGAGGSPAPPRALRTAGARSRHVGHRPRGEPHRLLRHDLRVLCLYPDDRRPQAPRMPALV